MHTHDLQHISVKISVYQLICNFSSDKYLCAIRDMQGFRNVRDMHFDMVFTLKYGTSRIFAIDEDSS